jgi:hypothetical protein
MFFITVSFSLFVEERTTLSRRSMVKCGFSECSKVLLPTCLGPNKKKLDSGNLFCRYLLNMAVNLPCKLTNCQ